MTKCQKIGLAVLVTLVTLIVCIHTWKSCTNLNVKSEKETALDSATYYHNRQLEIEKERRLYEEREQYHKDKFSRLEDSLNIADNSEWLNIKRARNRAIIDSANAEAVRKGTRR